MRYSPLIFLALAACSPVESSSDTADTTMTETPTAAAKVALATYDLAEPLPGVPKPAFHAAQLSGELAVDGGCLGLVSAGKFTTLAFAPDEAMWDRQRQMLVVKGIDYPLGTTVSVGGSATGGPAVAGLSSAVPEECRSGPVWFVPPGSISTDD